MSAPAIDRATFEALKETTGAQFALELVDTFLQEAPAMLDELRRMDHLPRRLRSRTDDVQKAKQRLQMHSLAPSAGITSESGSISTPKRSA